MRYLGKTVLTATGALALSALASAPLSAQRDPAYAQARANGEVGEQIDGYLGVVGAATPELRRLVDDINIKRRAVYARKAQENNATLEQYALTAGCQAIARTVPGEKYQAPDRTWKTRTSEPPERLPQCP
ncbi:MAG: YdbL family protein [Erythrobacter sp.]|uniref:YdbL family protein n=1 Tax=Erythrobacter sp. TaxID=1042 RepID=UPI00262B2AD7|nr:YdbL family protein [Erythrobacter sp.]MDJ0977989.1 YdbL family protein [Erythrobacter sp.]